MKYKLIFIFLVLSIQSFACDCSLSTPSDRFVSADFVGRIKIVKVYPNEKNARSYKADVEIVEHFKGDTIKSIYIAGRSDGRMGSSCNVYFPEGSDLLIFARIDSGGRVSFGMCSFPIDFKNSQDKDLRDLETIRILSKYGNSFTAKYNAFVSPEFPEFLESKKGIELKEKFSLFEVVLEDEVTPYEVNIIKGFGEDIDSEIVNALLNSTWEIRYYTNENSIGGKIKVIVSVYFYPAQRDNQSFLSSYAL